MEIIYVCIICKLYIIKYSQLEGELQKMNEFQKLNDLETKIINTYKDAAEFYNMCLQNNDTGHAYARMSGMCDMAEALGYVLYAHHKNDVIGFKYDYVTIAKDGKVLAEMAI